MAIFNLHPDSFLDIYKALKNDIVTTQLLEKELIRIKNKGIDLNDFAESFKLLSSIISTAKITLEEKEIVIVPNQSHINSQYVTYKQIQNVCNNHNLKAPAKNTLNTKFKTNQIQGKFENSKTKFLVTSLVQYFKTNNPDLINVFS